MLLLDKKKVLKKQNELKIRNKEILKSRNE